MDLGIAIVLSCGMSFMCLIVLSVVLVLVVRSGGRGIAGAFSGLFGGGDEQQPQPQHFVRAQSMEAQGAPSSGTALRRRAQELDFDRAVQRHSSSGFESQSAPPERTIKPSRPALSPARPFDRSSSEPNQPRPSRPEQEQQQRPQQGGLGEYKPPLRSGASGSIPGEEGGIPRNKGRDSRFGDDYDRIYDEQQGGNDLLDLF